MGEFHTELDTRTLSSGRVRLLAPLMYSLDKDQAADLLAAFNRLPEVKQLDYLNKSWTAITVPGNEDEGFVTDGASIPRPLWSIVGSPLTGNYKKPAVVHDYLCENKICSRKLGDNIFLRAMKDEGVGWFKRYAIYWGVRSYAVVTRKK